jgi:hypothetical protein
MFTFLNTTKVCKVIFKCLLFSTKSSRTRSKEPRSQGSLSTKYPIPLQQEVRTPKAKPNWGKTDPSVIFHLAKLSGAALLL